MSDRSEHDRLREAHENHVPWYRWGPYLSERQWGTVREDYSPGGTAWEFLSHEQARSHAYRWGEDGLLGISDEQARLCFALALWNGVDPILKERLFGLTNSEGNHGEDVKEYYFFLDNTPTHAYMKALYKYPQRVFPYTDLVETNRQRSRTELEYELADTGIFADQRYFDVLIEYAKASPTDILIRISATNRGPNRAPLHLLPTLWYRNTWAWGFSSDRPALVGEDAATSGSNGHVPGYRLIRADHQDLGTYWLACDGAPQLLFTENESNAERLWGAVSRTPYVKDGINDTVVNGVEGRVNPQGTGTKAAAHYVRMIDPGATEIVLLRLSERRHSSPFEGAADIFSSRKNEADAFYSTLNTGQTEDMARVQRQAFAGLLWSKQYYAYDVEKWLRGDPAGPPPPPERGRNRGWRHLSNQDIILMPDTWEYPWFASWDLAFHTIPMAMIDIEFAKRQTLLLLDDRYMHPNGQLPAYEWAFGDVNPPVQAWATWQLYQREKSTKGHGDTTFLKRVFNRLMLNFTWWVNRKDSNDNNVFQGGFLGLDNIGVFDRSMPLPSDLTLEQSDGTAWMGMFCLAILAIALELAAEDVAYEDIVAKFLDHFMYIADAINSPASEGGLWDPEDEFFYDRIVLSDGARFPVKVRSLVGFIPLLAAAPISRADVERFPWLVERVNWFIANRPYLPRLVTAFQDVPAAGHEKPYYLLALARGPRLRALLRRMLDPQEFLSDYGIRSISRYHAAHPYMLDTRRAGHLEVRYAPAESGTGAFGGNSNWRGPIWFPINYLLVETLQRYHRFYGDELQVDCPTGSGHQMTLRQVSDELAHRLTRIFLRDDHGDRPVHGGNRWFQEDPHWRDHLQFYEYFHGDIGAGIGASHQTGWTALVATLLEQLGMVRARQEGQADSRSEVGASAYADASGRAQSLDC